MSDKIEERVDRSILARQLVKRMNAFDKEKEEWYKEHQVNPVSHMTLPDPILMGIYEHKEIIKTESEDERDKIIERIYGTQYQTVPPPEDTYIEPTKYDVIERPKHYQFLEGIEVIDIIGEATKELKGIKAVGVANALKYLLRCTKKEDMLQDIKKARKYLDFIINER